MADMDFEAEMDAFAASSKSGSDRPADPPRGAARLGVEDIVAAVVKDDQARWTDDVCLSALALFKSDKPAWEKLKEAWKKASLKASDLSAMVAHARTKVKQRKAAVSKKVPEGTIFDLSRLPPDERELVILVGEDVRQPVVYEQMGRSLNALKKVFVNGDAEGWRVLSVGRAPPSIIERAKKNGITIDDWAEISFTVGAEELQDFIHRECRVLREKEIVDDDGPKTIYVPADIPGSHVRSWLKTQRAGSLPLLRGVHAAPVMRPDGTISDVIGYDDVTEYWIANHGMKIDVPERPTRDQAMEALRKFTCPESGLLRTFPFAATGEEGGGVGDAGELNRIAAVAMILGMTVRTLLGAGSPIFFLNATAARTGKGYLWRVACYVAFGAEGASGSLGDSEDEGPKRMSHLLTSGANAVLLDNFNGVMKSDDLCSLTGGAGFANIRVFGSTTKSARVEYGFVLGLTGNGTEFTADLQTRIFEIKQDAGMQHPEARRFPYLADDDAMERREVFVSAALTIVRWGIQNPSRGAGRPVTSFTEFWPYVRDPLLQLTGVDVARAMDAAKATDPEIEVRTELFDALAKRFGWNEFRAEDVWNYIVELRMRDQGMGRPDYSPEDMAVVSAFVAAKEKGKASRILGAHKEKYAGGYQLRFRDRGGAKIYWFRVAKDRTEEEARSATEAADEFARKASVVEEFMDGLPKK